ncbi:hypothetical protein CVT26_014392 [Gymnopilus dilepis]|uniref:FAD/NAD(P)-binding domain-containing protein n=1 Tax=Gymnopilus dilepis TaxID=231916 RepID=A0A409Y7F8_9AGAR|nr:hypothetical protein CVT26_014392 [Gymnopilus dilepis]
MAHATPSSSMRNRVLSETVGILGAGIAGLINAQILLRDGFTNVTVITRDRSVGGVWSRDRVYPGLCINNVHGEYRFSSLEMPPPESGEETGGHITGLGMCGYMETFYSKFLKDRATFKFETEILNVKRGGKSSWQVNVQDLRTSKVEVLNFARIVLCTGGCSNPKIPPELNSDAAKQAGFKGLVIHSSEFRSRYDDIVAAVQPKESGAGGTTVVVGGGKSAMDICARLANEGHKVVQVFETTDVFLASTSAIPPFIRKSRFLSVFSPHIVLRTRLERFLHTTTLGSAITHFILGKLQEDSFAAYQIPKDSPLRNSPPFFYSIRTNDEGKVHPTSYYSLVNSGKIQLEAPTRALGYSNDGKSLILENGKEVEADVVVLATGWQSSWTNIFDKETAAQLGLGRHEPTIDVKSVPEWDYKTLANPPAVHPDNESQKFVTSVYRGLVPARNIENRDLAVAGALFSTNNGYTSEVAANWISAYFQDDPMRLPSTAEEAVRESEIASLWMRRRYPNMLSWVNESYSASLDFWTWPQAADELLEDMYLSSMRSGGNWLTWPFKVIDLKELSTLKEERDAIRARAASS